jgi:hypothetical protein
MVVNYVVLFSSFFVCVKRWYGNSIHDVATIGRVFYWLTVSFAWSFEMHRALV